MMSGPEVEATAMRCISWNKCISFPFIPQIYYNI